MKYFCYEIYKVRIDKMEFLKEVRNLSLYFLKNSNKMSFRDSNFPRSESLNLRKESLIKSHLNNDDIIYE